MSSYRELLVWQKSIDFVIDIYKLTNKFPKEEMYGLSSQMRRAAISIPSNIAEGRTRHTDKEFARFLFIAQGSRAELETHIIICEKLNYIKNDELVDYMNKLEEIGKMITSLKKKILV